MGQHTPGGEKYNTARPVKPSSAAKKTNRVREQESEPPAEQLATPPATPQPAGPDPVASGSTQQLAEQEAFRECIKNKREAEKRERFRQWEEETEKAGK